MTATIADSPGGPMAAGTALMVISAAMVTHVARRRTPGLTPAADVQAVIKPAA